MRRWPGLRVRRSGARLPRAQHAASRMRDSALNSALSAMQEAPIAATFALLGATPTDFKPHAAPIAAIIARTAADARGTFGACAGADAATEAYTRIVDNDIAPGSAALLAEVAKAAATDCDAQRRAARVQSVLAHAHSKRIVPDGALVQACFHAAVAAADLRLAAALHNFAIANHLCTWPPPDTCSPHVALLRTSALPGDAAPAHAPRKRGTGAPVISYYNGIIRAAIFTQAHQVAATAFRELHASNAGADAQTIGLLAATHADQDDFAGALDLVTALRALGDPVPTVAYAALVRWCGRNRDFPAAYAWCQQYFHDCAARNVDILVSPVLTADRTPTAQTIASSRHDVPLATLFAARSAVDAQGAVHLLHHLRDVLCIRCSQFASEVVVQTCWRANRPDLVALVRCQLEQPHVLHTAQQPSDTHTFVGGWAAP